MIAIRRGLDRVARLVSRFVDAKPGATEGQHLGHEGQPVQPTVRIQRRQDLTDRPDLHPFACAQAQFRLGRRLDIAQDN
jgi:hypothetical protein